MKYKVAIFIVATTLFIGFYFTCPASAATLNSILSSSNNVLYSKVNDTRIKIIAKESSSYHFVIDNNLSVNISPYYNGITADVYYADNFDPLTEPNRDLTGFVESVPLGGFEFIINLKGNTVSNASDNYFSSLEDYEESLQPSWWENVKNAFLEFTASGALADVLSGDWISYINEVLFGDLWTVKVGEGEDELVEFYTISATPSPSPTPTPTQIPVQVNIDPTSGNVTYHYNIDVSGTPVPTSSPINPNPPSGTGGGGSELTEPFGVTDYYEPDDSLSIPNLRIFQFQLDLPGSNTDIGVDSLDNNVVVMNGYLEDNADAITTVSSFFQVIPSDWFLLLGAIACFPIIAAMIKSLLGG